MKLRTSLITGTFVTMYKEQLHRGSEVRTILLSHKADEGKALRIFAKGPKRNYRLQMKNDIRYTR